MATHRNIAVNTSTFLLLGIWGHKGRLDLQTVRKATVVGVSSRLKPLATLDIQPQAACFLGFSPFSSIKRASIPPVMD